jgi:hypothetical protein
VNYVVNNAKESLDSHNTDLTVQQEEQVKLLRAEWGEAFDDNVQRANIALDEFLPNAEDRALMSSMKNNTALLKLLANASKLMTEDQFIGHGNGSFGNMTPEEALTKARDIQGQKDHPYRNPSHPSHKDAKEEVANLYKIAYPE